MTEKRKLRATGAKSGSSVDGAKNARNECSDERKWTGGMRAWSEVEVGGESEAKVRRKKKR